MAWAHEYSAHPLGPRRPSHLGAGHTGGLAALQLESGDDPHLSGAVASRAHISHHTLPRLEPEAPQSGLPAPQTPDFPSHLSPINCCLMWRESLP